MIGGGGGGGGIETLIKSILGGGAAAPPEAPDEGMPAEDPSASMGPPAPAPAAAPANLAGMLPPSIVAKVKADPTTYENLHRVMGGDQTKVPPRKPIDYLIAAASPMVAGLAQMMMSNRRSDRKGNFFAGLAGGGLQSLVSEAGRGDRVRSAQREKDIADLLLQQKVRGTPLEGQDPTTGKGVAVFPGTGEVIPGVSPVPKNAPAIETRTRKDEQGNEIQEEYDRSKQTWVPSMREETTKDASGKLTTTRVPFKTPKQPDKPQREFRAGSDIPGAKKGTEDDQYYFVEPGKAPVASGLYRSASDRPTREGDINREEKHQVNQWAVKALAASHEKLGPKAKPEEYANDAVETFRKAAGTSPELAKKASEVATAIHTLGRNIRSGDELAELVKTFLAK
jgi:hypothetical protein